MTQSVGPHPNPLMRNVIFLGLCLFGAGALVAALWRPAEVGGPSPQKLAAVANEDFQQTLANLDAAFHSDWQKYSIEPVDAADTMAIARRLSLALTGTIPSLEEIRKIEALPEDQQITWWVEYLLEDRRSADYLAERFARAFVGVENGPFLVYRRNPFVSWLSDQLHSNRPYDELARDLIASQGIWTSEPASNFITVTIDQNNDRGGPDEIKLAARVTRAFLGVRIDCMQCHDDKFGDRWKQKDFHQLAAFFSEAEVGLSGVLDKKGAIYETRYRGKTEEEPVSAKVPFAEDLYPDDAKGTPREKLATWVTHPENSAFARATVNRIWALMFNRPLIEAVDDLPLDGPFPAGMEILADDLVAHDFDLRRLIRLIAASEVYQRDSRAPDPNDEVTSKQQNHWAAFPLTRMRPEQMARSISQSASLVAIDADAHIVRKLASFGEQTNFIKRYGDLGEDEFGETAGTIPQRLLMMNGQVVSERTKNNMVMNASTRIGALAPNNGIAVDTAFLATLTRRPTDDERSHFVATLDGTRADSRARAMEDLYWSLLNSTEFSWNH